MKKENEKGFTLLELLITISILAILAAIAFPSYQNFINRQKIRSAVNEWQSAYYFAQREAMRLKEPVFFCGSDNGTSCKSGAAHNFDDGWIVYRATEEGTDILKDVDYSDKRVSLQLNNVNSFKDNGLQFYSNGRLRSAVGTLTVDLKDNPDKMARELRIGAGGRLVGAAKGDR